MDSVRVYQLAKELNVQSALILELLDRMGRDVKSDLSTLDMSTADIVREEVTRAIDVEKKRLIAEREVQEKLQAEEAAQPTPLETPKAEAPATEDEPAKPAARVAAPQPASKPVKDMRRRIEMPAKPGVHKPRVFPARRIPTPAALAKQAPRPGAGRGLAPAAARPGAAGPPTGLPPRAAPGRPVPPLRRRRKKERVERTPLPARPKADLPPVPEAITLSEGVTVKELAEKLNRKSKDIIAKLIGHGVLATINQPLEPDTAIAVAKEFGSEAKVISFEEEARYGVAAPPAAEEAEIAEVPVDVSKMIPRPPVVTVMGHVDHGKTSLLDAIRAANVVDSEAGGITQHIGAYQIEENGRSITFLDTPGHEAFTLMRARGARATDIVVLVVAADDGVKPQTKEAIDHARAADVPLVVAINKIDKPNANVDRVKQQLADYEVVVEDYGGDAVSCEVSAKKRQGLDHLLEMVLLVADLKELRADPAMPATGVVLETRLDRARGIIATVLVQNGTLKVADSFIAGNSHGKVRAMTDQRGVKIESAGPSTPVEVMGYADEPRAGDLFQAIRDEARARQIAIFRQNKLQAERQGLTARRTLESFSDSQTRELPVLIKADVHGSLEALQHALKQLPSEKIRVNVLRGSVGGITQADVLLASASNALIIGFNVRPDRGASDLAKQEQVQLRLYTVIYDLVDDIEQALLGMLEPTIKETVLGQAEVRQLFKVSRVGTIAGCYVTQGKVTRNAEVRLLRESVVIYTGKLNSLRRFKDDVAEVKQGYECGIDIANYNDLKEGDAIEFFIKEKVAAESL